MSDGPNSPFIAAIEQLQEKITALQAQAVIDAQIAESLRERCGALEKENHRLRGCVDSDKGCYDDAAAALEKERQLLMADCRGYLTRIEALEKELGQANCELKEYAKDSDDADEAFIGMMKMRDAERQARAGLAERCKRLEAALTATDPINGDYAVMLAEVAKSVCYWRGKDMCLPDPRDYREAASHIATIKQALNDAKGQTNEQ